MTSVLRILSETVIKGQAGFPETVWKQMGSPPQPTAEQYAKLEAAGQLQLLTSPEWRQPKDGKLTLGFTLPHHAVSLIRLTW